MLGLIKLKHIQSILPESIQHNTTQHYIIKYINKINKIKEKRKKSQRKQNKKENRERGKEEGKEGKARSVFIYTVQCSTYHSYVCQVSWCSWLSHHFDVVRVPGSNPGETTFQIHEIMERNNKINKQRREKEKERKGKEKIKNK